MRIMAVRAVEQIVKALTGKMGRGTVSSISDETVWVVKHNIATQNCGKNKNYCLVDPLKFLKPKRG